VAAQNLDEERDILRVHCSTSRSGTLPGFVPSVLRPTDGKMWERVKVRTPDDERMGR
jgi:hypothetical protein